jgi:hypothetical protein
MGVDYFFRKEKSLRNLLRKREASKTIGFSFSGFAASCYPLSSSQATHVRRFAV